VSTVPILCLHAVDTDTAGPLAPWVMTPERLDEHLDALADAGYRPKPLDEVVTQLLDGDGFVSTDTIVLTIDDGYADVADVVWPRLKARGWPATLYVTTARVGGTFLERAMLSRDRLVDLADDGLDIGAHGHTHVALDTIAPAQARDEIVRSRELLRDWTGQPVPSFAYPHGFHDRRVRSEVVRAGFHHACAVKQALSSADDDRFALARIMPTGDVTADELVARLRSPKTPVADGGREALRTTAYRYVRRARRRQAAA
jgi:peptidoglycan/xylan/chitin deacetylase (PgdA/CDA1 family)